MIVMLMLHFWPVLPKVGTSADQTLSLESMRACTAVEIEILRVHVRSDFVLNDNYIDPNKCKPVVPLSPSW